MLFQKQRNMQTRQPWIQQPAISMIEGGISMATVSGLPLLPAAVSLMNWFTQYMSVYMLLRTISIA